MSNYSPPAPANAADGLVNKLHDAIQTFRREKDVERRNRDLSAERLAVAVGQRQSEEAKTARLQEELEAINRKIAAGNRDEMGKKQNEVGRLERETNFQHDELVRKKEKLSRLEATMRDDDVQRKGNVRSVRRSVQIWREKCSLSAANQSGNADTNGGHGTDDGSAADAATAQKLRLILQDVQERDPEAVLSLLIKLPALVESKAQSALMDADDAFYDCEMLHSIGMRHRGELGLGPDDVLDAEAQEEEQKKQDQAHDLPIMMEFDQPVQ